MTRSLHTPALLCLALCLALTGLAHAQELEEEDRCKKDVILIDLRIGPDGLGQLGFPDMVNGAYQVNWHYTGISPEVMEQIREKMDGSSRVPCDVMAEIVDLLRDTPEPGPAQPGAEKDKDWGPDRFGDPLEGPPFKWGEDRDGRPYRGPNGFNGYGVDPEWAAANGVPGAIEVTPGGYWTDDYEWVSYYDLAGQIAYAQGQADAAMALYVVVWDEVQTNEALWAALEVTTALGGIAQGIRKVSEAAVSHAAQALGKTQAQIMTGVPLGASTLVKSAGPDGLLRSFWEECVIRDMIGGRTAEQCLHDLGNDVDHWNGEVSRLTDEINSVPHPGEVWRIFNGGLYK